MRPGGETQTLTPYLQIVSKDLTIFTVKQTSINDTEVAPADRIANKKNIEESQVQAKAKKGTQKKTSPQHAMQIRTEMKFQFLRTVTNTRKKSRNNLRY